MSKSPFESELIEILSKAVNNKIYGSVEIYFENGSITQVTQRIIKKMRKGDNKPAMTSGRSKIKSSNSSRYSDENTKPQKVIL
jgi:hypothetical protein